jgi:hypothetical protein
VEIACAGVSFGGGKNGATNAWLATGRGTNLGLEIVSLIECNSHQLKAELSKVANLTALGLDFPFSFPVLFLDHLAKRKECDGFQSWQSVAEHLAFCSLDQFMADVVSFGRESTRTTEKGLAKATSRALQNNNPAMAQLAFHGIRLLATLNPAKYFVLPFQDQIDNGCAVMEVLPQETLSALSVPDSGYKGKTTKAAGKRQEVITALAKLRDVSRNKDCPRLTIPKNVERMMLENEDALEAVVACYTAAAFKSAPHLFSDPLSSDDLNVLLEGWIYAPSLPR